LYFFVHKIKFLFLKISSLVFILFLFQKKIKD